MNCSRAAAARMQLDAYVQVVPRIYGAHDQHRSLWDVWCHTLHHGASVAERVRKQVPKQELRKEIADFTLWLLTMVQKLSGRPSHRKRPDENAPETLIRIGNTCSDLIWHRYPGVCHLCYARRTKNAKNGANEHVLFAACDCSTHGPDNRNKKTKRRDSVDLLTFSEEIRRRKPKNIDEWQTMFAHIFRANKELAATDIAFHLMEELGEASDALVRMYSFTKKDFRAREPNWRQARLEGQIADVFSRLYALVEKLNEVEPTTLSGIIWERYGSDRLRSFRCPTCGTPICSCPLVFVPPNRSVSDWLQRFQAKSHHGRRKTARTRKSTRTK
jgi:NTP pyrophosphatase (non-canonical NTP hydrolase)